MRWGDVLLFEKGKDGGPESKVDGFWIFRHKKLFSVALLRFNKGSREAYHSHAFNAVSWVLTGGLMEVVRSRYGWDVTGYCPSIKPVFTPRDRMHKVYGVAEDNWVFSLRGPWKDEWQEVVGDEVITLTHNRVRVSLGELNKDLN
jgi:hypothetical protein